MKAGGGVWHDGWPEKGEPFRFFQLWVALPPAQESEPAESQYISPADVEADGPVRVILGRYGNASSRIRAPAGINYFPVRLEAGQRWRYAPPVGQTVAWLAVNEGRLATPRTIDAGQLAVLEQSDLEIDLLADRDTDFVLGTAVRHPHPLVLGNYSVHTSAHALMKGEEEIRRIGRRLRAEGRLP